MQNTSNLNLKKPEGTDLVDINDLNDNADTIDGKFGASSGHGHSGAAGDGPKITATGLAAGAATDAVIGNRTIADTAAPTADTAAPTTLLSGLGNMIKQITGGATWRTAPAMTIAAIKAILDAAVSAATANAIIKRDASGRAQVAAPSAAADIARKDTVDAVQTNLTTHAADTTAHLTAAERNTWNAKASTAAATTAAAGLMSASDKSKLDGVANNANNYTHPSTHSPAIIAQDSSNRFVSDAEKSTWNGKADLVATPQQTTADITYYVRTDGNDANTGLANTAAGAFKTISKALLMIPQTVNHSVTVNVAAGAYAEVVSLLGYVGLGRIEIVGDTVVSATRQATGFYMLNNTVAIYVKGFRATNTAGAGFYGSSNLNLGLEACSVIATAAAQPGFDFGGGGGATLNGCLASNRNAALNVNGSCHIISYSWQVGSGNAYGISVYFGKVSKNGTQPAGATPEYVIAGGEIGGPGVINPWGDNNTQSRTGAAGGSTAAQNMVSSTMTKLVYNGEYFDYLNEWNPATGTFTPTRSGMYTFDVLCSLQGVPDGVVISLHMFKNGAEDQCIGRNTNSGSPVSVTSGHVTTDLTAGQPVSIYLHQSHSSGLSTTGNNLYNWFRVARVS